MSDVVETVTITTDNGPVRINKSDFDPATHSLDDGSKQGEAGEASGTVIGLPRNVIQPPAPSAPNLDGHAARPAAPSPNQLMVLKRGSKYFVTGQGPDYAPLKDVPGIENDGYKSEKLAVEAIGALPDAKVPEPVAQA